MDINDFIINGILKIEVKTNSRKTQIIKFDNQKKIVYLDVHAKPENNKANIIIEKFLGKLTKLNAKIIRGFKSKKKIVKFD